MQFLSVLFIYSFTTAAPVQKQSTFTLRTFNEMSISCGTAGNAEEAAKAALPPDLNPANFAEMSQEDIQVIHQERLNAEEAETSCFVPLLKSLKSGDPKYDELYGGLIANKVLKLKLELTVLDIKKAQGQVDVAAIKDHQTKLEKNIALDKSNDGKKMIGVNYGADAKCSLRENCQAGNQNGDDTCLRVANKRD